jgi:electron transfer flavoprotein alpha subunit
MSVLVLVEHDNHVMHASTAHVVRAAQALSDEIILLVAGEHCKAVADEAAMLENVSRVWCADNVCYAHALAENLSELVCAHLDDRVKAVLAPATTFGKDVLPRVAALQDVAQVSDVVGIVSDDTFEHPIYAGNAIETVRVLDALKVLTVRMTAFDAVTEQQTPCPIDALDTVIKASNTTFVDASVSVSVRPELSAAKRVVSGGRGLQSAEQFKLIEELADVLDAAVGASRAAVDAGFVSNDHQVGQTGKMVAPSLYVAVGISGAVQHLAGMKDSKTIVAINKDEEAPIFQIADYALVGDLFTLVPELIQKIKA